MGNETIRKVWVVAFFLMAFAVFWFTRRIILLLFAAALIALILTSLTNLLRRVLPLGRKTGLLLVLILLSGAITGFGFWVGPSIANEFGELADRLPKLFSETRARVESSALFQRLQPMFPAQEGMASGGTGKVFAIFSSTFEAVSSFFFIVFSALFLAAAPDFYKRTLIKLFPPNVREDVKKTIARIIRTLKYWLFGQLISMVAVGVITGVAFAIAGIPFAMELGILAGLGEFIPFIGPLLVSIPALLLGLSEGTDKFLIVLAIVMIVQFIEGNVIMPIVQKKAIELPPVVMLTSMLILGSAFGLLGLFVAVPLMAIILVVTEDWYLRRYLGTKDKLLE